MRPPQRPQTFLHKQLRLDPRLKPEGLVVRTDHLNTCTSCAHAVGLQRSLHRGGALAAHAGATSANEGTNGLAEDDTVPTVPTINVGTRTQLLVDDWVVHTWQNVIRVLEPPRSRRPLPFRNDGSGGRFGCPCSAVEQSDGRVRLYYSADGPFKSKQRYTRYPYRVSKDGWSAWSDELGDVSVSGVRDLDTLAVSSQRTLRSRTGGCEGRASEDMGGLAAVESTDITATRSSHSATPAKLRGDGKEAGKKVSGGGSLGGKLGGSSWRLGPQSGRRLGGKLKHEQKHAQRRHHGGRTAGSGGSSSSDAEQFCTFSHMAGYQGSGGRACLARSHDGVEFEGLMSDRDRSVVPGVYRGDMECFRPHDKHPGSSVLGRAGDAYITPVVDHIRQREYASSHASRSTHTVPLLCSRCAEAAPLP